MELPEPNPMPSARMFAAIGHFTLNWSALEMGLDFLVVLAFHQFGGKKIEKECPKALNRKIEHLRKCCAKTPKLAPYKARCLQMLDQVEALSDKRHRLIHGYPTKVDATGEQFGMLKIIHDKRGFHLMERTPVTFKEILETSVASRKLAGEIIKLGFELVLLSYPSEHEFVKALRKLEV